MPSPPAASVIHYVPPQWAKADWSDAWASADGRHRGILLTDELADLPPSHLPPLPPRPTDRDWTGSLCLTVGFLMFAMIAGRVAAAWIGGAL